MDYALGHTLSPEGYSESDLAAIKHSYRYDYLPSGIWDLGMVLAGTHANLDG